MCASGDAGLSFLDHSVPPMFVRRVLTIPPGADRAAETTGWPDAVVVVERGQIELVRPGGGRGRFGRGDILWMGAGTLRTLRNPGREVAMLVAVFRRDDFPGGSPSQPVR